MCFSRFFEVFSSLGSLGVFTQVRSDSPDCQISKMRKMCSARLRSGSRSRLRRECFIDNGLLCFKRFHFPKE